MRLKSLKTTEITCKGGGFYHRPQEKKQDKPKNNTDKPFCVLLNEVIKKAYPNSR